MTNSEKIAVRLRAEADIEALTGLGWRQQQECRYRCGLAHLNRLLPNDAAAREALAGHGAYWVWWRREWHERNLHFIQLCYRWAAQLYEPVYAPETVKLALPVGHIPAVPLALMWRSMPAGVPFEDVNYWFQGRLCGGMPQYYRYLYPAHLVRMATAR